MSISFDVDAGRTVTRRTSRSPRRRRGAGVAAAVSAGLHLAVAIGLFAQWRAAPVAPAAPEPPVMIVLLSPVSPPSPLRDVAPGDPRIERKAARPEAVPEIRRRSPLLPALPDAPPMPIDSSSPSERQDPGPVVLRTTAPATMEAPPASRAASAVAADWRARVLARLEAYRRYPGNARAQRLEGTVLVVMRVDRSGVVLSARVGRSSGHALLDRGALETVRRAAPLPPPPPEMANPVDVSVPVEFYLSP